MWAVLKKLKYFWIKLEKLSIHGKNRRLFVENCKMLKENVFYVLTKHFWVSTGSKSAVRSSKLKTKVTFDSYKLLWVVISLFWGYLGTQSLRYSHFITNLIVRLGALACYGLFIALQDQSLSAVRSDTVSVQSVGVTTPHHNLSNYISVYRML